MRRQPLIVASLALLAAALLAGCGGNKKNNAHKATISPTSARSTVSGSPGPTVAQTASPLGTPFAGTTSACTSLGAGPGAPTPAAAAVTAEPPFVVATQPVRPAIDLNEFSVNPQYIPSGFKSNEAPGQVAKIAAADLAQTTANPQATVAHLNNIGFLGGRQQAWAGPQTQGRIPSIFVDHLVFSTDAGATDFLSNPPFAASICVRPESGPQLGQESIHVFYAYNIQLATGGTGPADGHGVYWRCGRADIVVTAAGAPGQITQGQVDDLARKLQADFVKKQPC